ncbi:MAG: YceI family protein [Ginsengibacter sp.]
MKITKWNADPMHTEITFKAKHLMITTVTGHFNKFDLEVETLGNDFKTVEKIEFSADVDSIDTNNDKRNAHLKSADFFNAEEYPKMKFSGTKYELKGEEVILQGNLTIRGTTKTVSMRAEFGGVVKDPWGGERAGFTISGKISRKEFGLNYNAITEAGGVVVSDEIKIVAEIQLVRLVTEMAEEKVRVIEAA